MNIGNKEELENKSLIEKVENEFLNFILLINGIFNEINWF